jgi:hypothetical protein
MLADKETNMSSKSFEEVFNMKMLDQELYLSFHDFVDYDIFYSVILYLTAGDGIIDEEDLRKMIKGTENAEEFVKKTTDPNYEFVQEWLSRPRWRAEFLENYLATHTGDYSQLLQEAKFEFTKQQVELIHKNLVEVLRERSEDLER